MLAAHYLSPALLKAGFGVGLIGLGGFLVYYDPTDECVPSVGEFSRNLISTTIPPKG